jgi:hypothetical protein
MNEHCYQHLQTILERLKLTRVSERLDQLAEEAAKESWTYVEFLDRVQGARGECPCGAGCGHENTPGSVPFHQDARAV